MENNLVDKWRPNLPLHPSHSKSLSESIYGCEWLRKNKLLEEEETSNTSELQFMEMIKKYNETVSACPLIWEGNDHDVEQVPIVGTYAFFCALGIFSNLIILYVLWDEHRRNKRKSASNSFILSLCFADTIQLAGLPFKIDVSYVLIVTICVWSVSIFLAVPSIIHSKYGNYECRLDWSASISIDSHQCSLCQTFEDSKFFECNLPNFTLAHDTQEKEWKKYCLQEIDDELYKSNFCPISNHFSQYLCVLFILGYVIPLIVIIYCYTNIIMISIRAGRKTSKGISGSHRARSKKASARDQKVTKIVLILVITFIFCWTPFHIRNIFQVWNIIPGAHTWKFILDFANLGCAANSVLNPFIYSFLSTQFRQKLCMVINQRIRRPAGSVSTGSIRSRRGNDRREVVSPSAPDRACVTPSMPTECSQLTQYNESNVHSNGIECTNLLSKISSNENARLDQKICSEI